MAFNFPDSPSENQVFSDANSGAQYIYKNGVWMQSSAAQIKLSALPRNRLVNGAFQVSQEYGSALITTTNQYVADQWPCGWVGPVFNAQMVWPGAGETNRLRMICTTAKPSLAAGDFVSFYTMVEGFRVYDFGWGTAAAKQVVLRFKWKSPAGTYSVMVGHHANVRSFIRAFTITAAQANVETLQTIVIPGDTFIWGWEAGAGISFYLYFVIAAGSTFTGGVDGWQSADKYAVGTPTNGGATVSNTFELGEVGMYLDPQATGAAPPWEMPDEAEELAACRRYWYAGESTLILPYTSATTTLIYTVPLPVQMRITPAIARTGNGSITGSTAGTQAIVIQPHQFHWSNNVAFAAGGSYTANARF